jgi:hypothetical protein
MRYLLTPSVSHGRNAKYSFKGFAERAFGIIPNQTCHFRQFVIFLSEQLTRLAHPPSRQIFQRGLANNFLESCSECGTRHSCCRCQCCNRPRFLEIFMYRV